MVGLWPKEALTPPRWQFVDKVCWQEGLPNLFLLHIDMVHFGKKPCVCCGLPFRKNFYLVTLHSTVTCFFCWFEQNDPSMVAILQIFPTSSRQLDSMCFSGALGRSWHTGASVRSCFGSSLLGFMSLCSPRHLLSRRRGETQSILSSNWWSHNIFAASAGSWVTMSVIQTVISYPW